MVKFGRHNATVRANLARIDTSYYVIDYNALKSIAITPNADHNDFLLLWKESLSNLVASRENISLDIWSKVFAAIDELPESKGVTLENALRLYVRVTDNNDEKESAAATYNSADLLRQFKRSDLANSHSLEALRKAVKKFDKIHTPSPSFSSMLLPTLHAAISSSPNFGQHAKSLTAALAESGSGDRTTAPRWWSLMYVSLMNDCFGLSLDTRVP